MIMTVEPKFIPNQAVNVYQDDFYKSMPHLDDYVVI